MITVQSKLLMGPHGKQRAGFVIHDGPYTRTILLSKLKKHVKVLTEENIRDLYFTEPHLFN
ncbi:hypothetical protein KUL118_01560 [Tenacibaculum sp. KUL118]|nr:hypothetical protein KUL118_01560 [Tenacibaculum sp. KUL118]